MAGEADRYRALLEPLAPAPDHRSALREALRAVEAAR